MATPNYDIDYKDSRFTEVEADKKAALNEVDVTYGNMISQSDKYYQQQIEQILHIHLVKVENIVFKQVYQLTMLVQN